MIDFFAPLNCIAATHQPTRRTIILRPNHQSFTWTRPEVVHGPHLGDQWGTQWASGAPWCLAAMSESVCILHCIGDIHNISSGRKLLKKGKQCCGQRDQWAIESVHSNSRSGAMVLPVDWLEWRQRDILNSCLCRFSSRINWRNCSLGNTQLLSVMSLQGRAQLGLSLGVLKCVVGALLYLCQSTAVCVSTTWR